MEESIKKNKYCKHISTQHRSIQIYKKNLGGLQKRYRQQHNYTRVFNSPLLKMDTSSKQNINKNTVELNDPLEQMDLRGIYTNIYPKETKYTFFFKYTWTILKIDHKIGHKTSLNKFKKFEIISSIFSDHKGLKQKLTSGRKLKNIHIHGD